MLARQKSAFWRGNVWGEVCSYGFGKVLSGLLMLVVFPTGVDNMRDRYSDEETSH